MRIALNLQPKSNLSNQLRGLPCTAAVQEGAERHWRTMESWKGRDVVRTWLVGRVSRPVIIGCCSLECCQACSLSVIDEGNGYPIG